MKSFFLRTALIIFLILVGPCIVGAASAQSGYALAADTYEALLLPEGSSRSCPESEPAATFILAANFDNPAEPDTEADQNVPEDADDSEDTPPDDEPLNQSNGPQIADPIEPFNRAMYQFNDKLYFWVLKPVASGYGKVFPEVVRVHVKNFFTNLAFPIRFVSSILQADPAGAAQETGRFFINTIWGLAGIFDPASLPGANLPKQNADLGQTFGLWGIGQGFYIVWPVFGPSSPRETIGLVGEFFLYPVSYINPWYASSGVRSYEIINDTSLRIGDYEALKGAAIDPYIAIRDAYVQYRYKKIEQKRLKLKSAQDEKTGSIP